MPTSRRPIGTAATPISAKPRGNHAHRSEPSAALEPRGDPSHDAPHRARPPRRADAAVHRGLARLRGNGPTHPARSRPRRRAGARLPSAPDRAQLTGERYLEAGIGLASIKTRTVGATEPSRVSIEADAAPREH